MAQREINIIRGPITPGYLKDADLKAIRTIFENITELVSLYVDKERVLYAIRTTEEAVKTALEASASASTQAQEANKLITDASNLLKQEVAIALAEAKAAQIEAEAVRDAVAKDSAMATESRTDSQDVICSQDVPSKITCRNVFMAS
mgnify:CR=1 FL=1